MSKIKYKHGFKFYLAEDFSLRIDDLPDANVLGMYKLQMAHQTLTICKGYMWDKGFRDKRFIRAQLVQEAMYQLIRLGYLPYEWRSKINTIYYGLMVEDGVPKPVAWMLKKWADVFGNVASNKSRKVLFAP